MLNEIIEKISEQSGLTKDEIKEKIKEKQLELSGLVSPEGAAHLVARELDINILERKVRKLEIGNIVPGMQAVEIIGRIYKILPPVDFDKNGKKGRVINLVIWDPTGTIRLSLWNKEVDIAKNLKENQVVEIKGYSRADNRGAAELRLGKNGKIEVKEVDFPEIETPPHLVSVPMKTVKISELRPGVYAKIRGIIVQIFEFNPFYEICPKCGARIKESEGKFFCYEHKWVKPEYSMIVSGIIDDGSDNIRVVFFREMAEKLLNLKTDDALKIAGEKASKTVPIVEMSVDVLGREFVLEGRVKKNEMFGRLEFIVGNISNVDIKKETESLLNDIKSV